MDFASLLPQKLRLLPFTISLPSALSFAHLNPIPHKYRANRRRVTRLRTHFPRSDDITRLQTSFNVLDTVRALRRHRWVPLDLQYVALACVALFSLYLAPLAPLFKLLGAMGGLLLGLMPITRQFFWPGMTIWVYLMYFFSSRFIPSEYRPHIWVRVLPALENVLYGANLSNILSAHTFSALDIIAWIPYGILHFALPAICVGILFLFAAPGSGPIFAWAFGWMNVIGVTIQLLFPCTPPWYENEHGLAPAAYGMPGSPAGLARIDAIFGFDMYTTAFSTAPVPFGAFPSLHSGNAVLEALFLSYCFPRLRVLAAGYVVWIWWATMYLSHHYAVDLVGGALIAALCFYVAKTHFMPRPQPDKSGRWEYEYVELGDRKAAFDEEIAAYSLSGLVNRDDSDEWTVGSSTSSWSGSGSGSISPTLSEESLPVRRGAFGEVDGRMWDGREELGEIRVVG
ncbi:related to aureobasidin-resistance protein [Cephalotrichum gorgonifer]|uniref:Related to aureobasidin-resistance protein n=1 Tax=Cephalotrichum gorgonifer TaxID=2041049 RepID=A0AAE8SU16_9PEZI|nr:related to aureobasidin-resistance protein [Cephalotrichum gorgonifer]